MIRIFILSAFMVFYTSSLLFSQNSIRTYGGINISNVKYHLIDRSTNLDSTSLRVNNHFLPLLGVDIDFPINNKMSITSGLGVSWMGSRNYNVNIPAGVNLDSNLKLGYMRLPLIINYEIPLGFKIFGGYCLSYNFRKNVNFNTFDENDIEINTYQPFLHAFVLGIRKDIGKWSLVTNYYKGISNVWDTKDYHRDYRAFLTIRSFQITLGYIIKEGSN